MRFRPRLHHLGRHRIGPLLGAALAGVIGTGPAAASDEFVIVDRELSRRTARVVEINELMLAYLDDTGALRTSSLKESIALLRPRRDGAPDVGGAAPPSADRGTSSGLPGALILTDGQVLPGMLAERTAADEVLGWTHPWLGRIDVPMNAIAAVTFDGSKPAIAPGGMDMVVLGNGDRIEGFVKSLGDPIRIDVDLEEDPHELTIPLGRTAGVVLVAQSRPPSGRRVWFRDGTLVSARRLRVADDGYVRIATEWSPSGAPPVEVPLVDVAGILFDPGSMVPLGRIAPSRIGSDTPRYTVPVPRSIDPNAPLDLGRISYVGPLIVHYALPPGCERFAADAVLPDSAQAWGDYELVIRDDDREVHRSRINAKTPKQSINVPIEGTELTIEIMIGANGPIQDRLLLSNAMLRLN